jgi:hypothetical protein
MNGTSITRTILGLLAASVYAAAGCEDASPSTPCVDGPPQGCAAAQDFDVCEDPTCTAVYACDNGRWVFDRACPRHEPSDAGDGASSGG